MMPAIDIVVMGIGIGFAGRGAMLFFQTVVIHFLRAAGGREGIPMIDD